ncbi:MAG: dUTP diphosphatase, partial [Clostridia bacterium]|nr:dUTP diphosphatase [Clostridia bacterium]
MSETLGVQIRLTRPGASVPKYATDGSAACDLTAAIDAPVTIPRGGSVSIPTGIAISMERSDVVAIVCARSGLAF